MILSDYPILSVRRIAWPAFACAGLDCLANKGAMFAVVAPPGASSPIDVVTTHLNSRRRAGVPMARSLKAYRRQTGLLALFVRRWHDPSRPIVIAGDFNVHDSSTRLAALMPAVASCCGSQPVRDALHEAAARGLKLSVAAESVLRLGRDWQFFAPGTRARLELTGAHTLFGPDLAGSTPSDHVAYEATFRLVPAGHPPGLMGKAPGSISPNGRGHSPA
jgi:hypothetical protein